MDSLRPALSVVVPMYNEEAVIPLFVARLRPVLDSLDTTYEVVVVDDGSTDATAAVVQAHRRTWAQLRIVRFRRNSGHQAALTAGLHRAFGAYVVSIDADLQDPPEVIADMLALAQASDLDVVYGVRSDRHADSAGKRWTASLYYRLMRRLVGTSVPANAGDFRLLSRATVDALRELHEAKPVYRLVIPWLGFTSGEVCYVRERRAAGRTKYPLSKMVGLAADSVVSFSAAPLRLAIWIGALAAGLCLVLVAFALAAYLTGHTVQGWSSVFVMVVFLGGTQLLAIGLLGEYVGRIYRALQDRPAYLIAYDSADSDTSPHRAPPDGPRTAEIIGQRSSPDVLSPY